MEAIILKAFTDAATSPTLFSLLISLSTLAIAAFFYFKKTNIQEITSAEAIHKTQIDGLIAQVKLLSEELTLARKQLTEIHEQNISLMKQVRESNSKIQELEDQIQKMTHRENNDKDTDNNIS